VDWRLLGQVTLIPALALARRGQMGRALATAARNADALLRDGLVPTEARLFADARAAVRAQRAGLYLQREHRRHLRRFRAAIAAHGLDSKADFARFCAGAGLPHPRTVAIGPDREPEALAAIGELQGARLFVKPASGARARGAAVAHRIGGARWRLVTPERARDGELGALLAEHLAGEWLVVQPLLVNASPLAHWAGEMLATFRIVTARAADGKVRTLSMLAELPLDAGAPLPEERVVFPVSPDGGALSPLDTGAAARLPALAAPAAAFAGRRIEAAGALRALAEAAHARLAAAAALPLAPTIGWDAAWTAEGPMLLEPNWNWAVAPHYRNAAGLDFALSPRFAAAVRDGG